MTKLMEYLQLAYAEAEYDKMTEVALLILLTLEMAKKASEDQEG